MRLKRRQFIGLFPVGTLACAAAGALDVQARAYLPLVVSLAGPVAAKLAPGHFRIFDAPVLRVGNEDFTIVVWTKLNGATPPTQNRFLVSKDYATGYNLVHNGPSGRFMFGIRGLSANVSAGAAVGVGNWHMVAGGHDSAAGIIWCSVDAAPAATAPRTTSPTPGSGDLAIGIQSTFAGPVHDGAVQRVGIWRRKLSASDLLTIHNGGAPPRYADLGSGIKTGLAAWWDMGEASGNRREAHAGLHHAFDVGGVGSEAGIGAAVVSPPITAQLICDGDSLTFGWPEPANYTYPVQAALNPGWRGVNVGANGKSSAAMLANAPTTVDPLFDPALARNVVVAWIGTNDLLTSVPLATIQSNIVAYVNGRRAVGFQVVLCTLTPTLYATRPATYDAQRVALNGWIISGASGANVVCDSGNSPILNDPLDTYRYSTDKIHLTKYGYHAVAQDVVNTL